MWWIQKGGAMKRKAVILALAACGLSAGMAQAEDYLHDRDFVYVGTRTYKHNVIANYIVRDSVEAAGEGTFRVVLFEVYNNPDDPNPANPVKYGQTWTVFSCKDKTVTSFSSKDYRADGSFAAHYTLRPTPVAMTPDAADRPAFDYVCFSEADRAAKGYWSSKATGIDPVTDADSRYKASSGQ
jgi:hypothetical protein